MNLLLIYTLVFFSTSLVTLSIVGWLTQVGGATSADSDFSEQSRGVRFRSITRLVNFLTAINEGAWCEQYRADMNVKLLHAGRPGGVVSAARFITFAQLLALLVWLIFIVLGVFNNRIVALGIATGGLLAGASFWLLTEYLQNLISERSKSISRSFPGFLDLAVMSTQAGASFLESLSIFTDNNRTTPLGIELGLVRQEIAMGATMGEALASFKGRISVVPVQSCIDSIVQGQKLGTPIAETLFDQADTMRFHRSQAAERAAEELKVKIMGPIVLMMIAVFLLILAPAVLEVLQSGVV